MSTRPRPLAHKLEMPRVRETSKRDRPASAEPHRPGCVAEQMTEVSLPAARRVPAALKIACAAATPGIGLVYARHYGTGNFLWLSDIALGLTTVAARPADTAAGEHRGGRRAATRTRVERRFHQRRTIDGSRRLHVRSKAFAVAARAIVVSRGAAADHAVAAAGIRLRPPRPCDPVRWTVLPLTYAFTDPEKNINWVFDPGTRPQKRLPLSRAPSAFG